MEYRLIECLERIIDNRGKNPKYYNIEKYPIIDNVYIKNNFYTNVKEVNRYINEETFKNFLRGYVEKDMPIMTLVGSGIGNVALVPTEKCAIVQNTIGFKTKKDILNNIYLYYWFITKQQELNNFNRGSGQPSIKKTDVENMIIDLPEIDIQEKIVKILYTIDKKIELNNHINDNLYKITNLLYEQLFIKERQEDWKQYNLTDLADISNGYSYSGKELVDDSDVGMATIKNFERTGEFKEDGFKPLNPIKAKEFHYAKKFDILVACTDLTQNADIIGNAIMLLNTSKFNRIVISMDLVKVIPKAHKYLIYSILNSSEFKSYALGYKTGTTVLHLNKECFKNFTIKLPDEAFVEKFEEIIASNYKKISANLEENNSLIELRNNILPKLINGEIDLENIKI